MYPTISDLLNDLFGFYIPLPIQTFGFFVALGFITAYYFIKEELRRKEELGLLHPFTRKVLTGKRSTSTDYVIAVVVGAVLGYKILFLALNYSAFVDDPQGFLLSFDGSLLGGLLGAALSAGLRYKDDAALKNSDPKWVQETIHPHELMGNVVAIAAISGILGAKIFHNLENPQEFAEDPIGAIASFSGLTFYGGLICGAIAVLYYVNRYGVKPWHMLDAAAPGLLLSYGVGRIGCHLSGDGDWGINNLNPKPYSWLPDWAWAYRYPNNVISEGIPVPGCEGRHCMMLEFPVYPTPFYEALACILLFTVLWTFRKKIRIPGLMWSVYLMINGLERFFIEKIRVNSVYHIFGSDITQAELISSVLFLLGLAGTLYFLFMKKDDRGGRGKK